GHRTDRDDPGRGTHGGLAAGVGHHRNGTWSQPAAAGPDACRAVRPGPVQFDDPGLAYRARSASRDGKSLIRLGSGGAKAPPVPAILATPGLAVAAGLPIQLQRALSFSTH